ncbi:MAG: glycosyltransferase [Flavobacteriaceae bacterium]|nr:glycosyltransferase [Flavobacteriaceae bacterium]
MAARKTIMVAPIHWGLGHATRCIPIIRALEAHGWNVLLGSDGAALTLLRKEFPHLNYIELPAYNIRYSKTGFWLKLKLFLHLPDILRTIQAEKRIISEYIEENDLDGIISDNRFGIRHPEVPSVFITHQLNVRSGATSPLTSSIHRRIIRKFDTCWVPDVEGAINLSGRLGHLSKTTLPITYLGPISRFRKKEIPQIYDVLCLLSGPEPQRSLFEKKCLEAFQNSPKKILLVQGVIAPKELRSVKGAVEIVNFLKSEALETAINQSEVVVSRSGYTTIMDLAATGKKAFFVPTPGQDEQQYLARRLDRLGLVPHCRQDTFSEAQLDKIPLYKGLKSFAFTLDYTELFRLFEREGKL